MNPSRRFAAAALGLLWLASGASAQPILIQPEDPFRRTGGSGISNLRFVGQSADGREVVCAMDFTYDGTRGPTAVLLPVIEKKDQKGVAGWFGADAITIGNGRGTVATKIRFFNDEPGVPATLTTDRIRVLLLDSSGRSIVGGGVFLKTIQWGVPPTTPSKRGAPAITTPPPSESAAKAAAKAAAEQKAAEEKAQRAEAQARVREEARRKREADAAKREEEGRLAEERRQAEIAAKAEADAKRDLERRERELAKAGEDARKKAAAESKLRLAAQAEAAARAEAARLAAEKRAAAEQREAAARAKAEAEAKRDLERRAAEAAEIREAARKKAESEAAARRAAEAEAQAREIARQKQEALAAARAAEISRQAEQARLAKAKSEEAVRPRDPAPLPAPAPAATTIPPQTPPPVQLAKAIPPEPSRTAPRESNPPSPSADATGLKSKITNVEIVNRSLDRSQLTVGVEYEYRDNFSSRALLGVEIVNTEDPQSPAFFTAEPAEIGKSRRNFVLIPVKFRPPSSEADRLGAFSTDKVQVYLRDGDKRYNLFRATMLVTWRSTAARPAGGSGVASNPGAPSAGTDRIAIDDFKQNDLQSAYLTVQYSLERGPGKVRMRVYDSSKPATGSWFATTEPVAASGAGLQLIELTLKDSAPAQGSTFTTNTLEVELLDKSGAVVARLKQPLEMSWAKE